MTTILDVAADIERVTGKTPITPRWEATLRVFYGLELRPQDLENLQASTHRTAIGLALLPRRVRREMWCRVGRRGRKSVVAALIAVFEAAFGGHERYLLQGEQGLIAIVSKDAAGSTLVARFCELHAQALGFQTNWSSIGSIRVLELVGIPFSIACFPCNAKAPRGWAIPVIVADEIAHWQTDSDSYANADESVLGAVKPGSAQFPDSKLIAISSPLGHDGVHYAMVEANLGDDADPDVIAVEGPTWEWNPEISAARTYELEKDSDTHSREFGAKVSDNEGTALVAGDVPGCFEPRHGMYVWDQYIFSIDPGETANEFAIIGARWGNPTRDRVAKITTGGVFIRDEYGRLLHEPRATRPLLQIGYVGGIPGETVRAIGMEAVVEQIAAIAHRHGSDVVLSDQRGAPYLTAITSRHGLRFRSFDHSRDSKHEAVILLRSLMRDRQIFASRTTRCVGKCCRFRAASLVVAFNTAGGDPDRDRIGIACPHL